MRPIHVSRHSGVPAYRQIIDQITFMIESGDLRDGDRLPSSRDLAVDLDVNRNTTARAYARLRQSGYLDPRGRGGMVVCRSEFAREGAAKRAAAVSALSEPIRWCIDMGLSPEDIAMIALREGAKVAKGY